jgi:hypothetical protein
MANAAEMSGGAAGAPDRETTAQVCGRCGRDRAGRMLFVLDGQPRCPRCVVHHRPMLRRSFLTALFVGTCLTAINHGNTLLGGAFPSDLWWKIPLTYCVPFCVATWGALGTAYRRGAVAAAPTRA